MVIWVSFIQYWCQISIYYKYAPDGVKIFVLSYVYDCVYWYTSGALGYMNFLWYTHWFMSIRMSHMKDNYISVDQDRYANSIVSKYLDTATVKWGKRFYKTTLPYDMILAKSDASTSDEQVEKLTR